jgi:hypothetical protein
MLINQNKQGFMPPIHQWSQNELKTEIIEKINNNQIFKNKKILTELMEPYNASSNTNFDSIWCIYVLIKFLDTNL